MYAYLKNYGQKTVRHSIGPIELNSYFIIIEYQWAEANPTDNQNHWFIERGNKKQFLSQINKNLMYAQISKQAKIIDWSWKNCIHNVARIQNDFLFHM